MYIPHQYLYHVHVDQSVCQSSPLRPSPPTVRARGNTTRAERVLHLIVFPWTNRISLRRFVPIIFMTAKVPHVTAWHGVRAAIAITSCCVYTTCVWGELIRLQVVEPDS